MKAAGAAYEAFWGSDGPPYPQTIELNSQFLDPGEVLGGPGKVGQPRPAAQDRCTLLQAGSGGWVAKMGGEQSAIDETIEKREFTPTPTYYTT